MINNILFLINPSARRASKKNINIFCALLREKNIPFTCIHTKDTQDGSAIAYQAALLQKYDMIAVAGGDGTLAAIASGLYKAKKQNISVPPIWIVPLGTANVLARELKIPFNPAKNAFYLIEYAKPCLLWPGILKNHEGETIFLQMASAGLDAETVAAVSYKLKKYIGPLAYITAFLHILKKTSPQITVRTCQHQKTKNQQKGACAIFTRGSLYGGPFCIAKNQHPSQKTSSLILFRRGRIVDLFRSLIGIFLPFQRLRKNLSVTTVSATHKIYLEGCGPIQADGDLKGQLPCQIACATLPLCFYH